MCHIEVYPTGRTLRACKIGLSRGGATPFVTRYSVADPKVTEGPSDAGQAQTPETRIRRRVSPPSSVGRFSAGPWSHPNWGLLSADLSAHVGRFGLDLVRRTTKVLLWIVALLLAVASAAIAATFLILEWPRAASARVNMAKRTSERPTKAQVGGCTKSLGKPQGDGGSHLS
jgi:hypothetical protein